MTIPEWYLSWWNIRQPSWRDNGGLEGQWKIVRSVKESLGGNPGTLVLRLEVLEVERDLQAESSLERIVGKH